MRLPDVGEGVAEAELVQWFVAVGDAVTADSALAEVLTDKATVEVASPVAGVVTALHGEPGDVLAVGSNLVEIETAGGDDAPTTTDVDEEPVPVAASTEPAAVAPPPPPPPPPPAPPAAPAHPRPTAAPAVRARALSLGLDLTQVSGSGPGGRIVHADLDRIIGQGPRHRTAGQPRRRPRMDRAAVNRSAACAARSPSA